MAISSGVGPHYAAIVVNGQRFPLVGGSTSWEATRKSGAFRGAIALGWPGVEQTFGPSLGSNQASIIVTTRGQTATLMTGEIDSFETDYIQGIVQFDGRDASAKLHAVKSSEKWINKHPDEIISDLAGRVGLSPQVDTSSLQAGRYVQIDWTKLTDGLSYASVIHRLCDLMGAHWYVQQNNLIVRTKDSSGAPYIVNYSRDATGRVVSDALGLRIRRNVQAGKPINVSVKSWDTHQKRASTGTYTIGGNGETQNYVYHLPGYMQGHAAAYAKSKARDHARHELTLEAALVGDPTIDGSAPLRLAGTLYAQDFRIDTLEHTFGMEGHVMTIVARSAAQGRSGA